MLLFVEVEKLKNEAATEKVLLDWHLTPEGNSEQNVEFVWAQRNTEFIARRLAFSRLRRTEVFSDVAANLEVLVLMFHSIVYVYVFWRRELTWMKIITDGRQCLTSFKRRAFWLRWRRSSRPREQSAFLGWFRWRQSWQSFVKAPAASCADWQPAAHLDPTPHTHKLHTKREDKQLLAYLSGIPFFC